MQIKSFPNFSASLRLCGLVLLAGLAVFAQKIPAPAEIIGSRPATTANSLRGNRQSIISESSTRRATALSSRKPAERSDDANVEIIARYPSNAGDILLSGWALGAGKIAGKAALVSINIGNGKVVLFGFRPQYRGQSLATFPLFFNAVSE